MPPRALIFRFTAYCSLKCQSIPKAGCRDVEHAVRGLREASENALAACVGALSIMIVDRTKILIDFGTSVCMLFHTSQSSLSTTILR